MERPYFYRIVRPAVCFLFKFVYRPTFNGLENIPKKGGFILAGNHTNNFDCLLIMSSTKRTVRFLAKHSLMKGIKKIIFKHMAIIPVDRSKKNPDAMKNAIEHLHQEHVIGIFPEGTINRTEDTILPFKFGAVKMAKDTSTPIIPFVIKGNYKPFHRGLCITFLKPLVVLESLEVENKKLEKIITEKLEG